MPPHPPFINSFLWYWFATVTYCAAPGRLGTFGSAWLHGYFVTRVQWRDRAGISFYWYHDSVFAWTGRHGSRPGLSPQLPGSCDWSCQHHFRLPLCHCVYILYFIFDVLYFQYGPARGRSERVRLLLEELLDLPPTASRNAVVIGAEQRRPVVLIGHSQGGCASAQACSARVLAAAGYYFDSLLAPWCVLFYIAIVCFLLKNVYFTLQYSRFGVTRGRIADWSLALTLRWPLRRRRRSRGGCWQSCRPRPAHCYPSRTPRRSWTRLGGPFSLRRCGPCSWNDKLRGDVVVVLSSSFFIFFSLHSGTSIVHQRLFVK